MYNNIYNAIIIMIKIHLSIIVKNNFHIFFMYNISDLISGKKLYDTTHRQDK